MLWKRWADQLSAVLIMGIPGLWVANHWVAMPDAVIGASIMGWTLVIQFYFRRSEPTPPVEPK